MTRWLFSLQFRLILGFALVLALALGSVSWYVGYAAERETERLQQEVEDFRASRVQQIISQQFSAPQGSTGLQLVVEQAGMLYGWHIVATDREGRIVGDSHQRFDGRFREVRQRSRLLPILSSGREVGTVAMAPSDIPEVAPEPPLSRLVSSLNRSLLWTGLGAGAVGILLASLMSRQVLAPVRLLTSAARRLGLGDLTQRTSASGRDEIGELGRTFNSMADGLEKAELHRRSLMADVAHELRTPLSNIQGYIEALRDGLLQPDSATIDTIYQQVLYLTHLVEDLRTLALAESGNLHLHCQPDSLEEVLGRSIEAVRPRAQAKGVSLSLQVPSAFSLVQMDRTRIAQVVGNLLENAIIHTLQGGSVTVSAEMIGATTARVTVADTGEGIPSEELPQVFERFYRVDPSRTRATGGVGLGLAIAKQLVEAHGGTILAESTPGEGSRFIFELPLADNAGSQGDEG